MEKLQVHIITLLHVHWCSSRRLGAHDLEERFMPLVHIFEVEHLQFG